MHSSEIVNNSTFTFVKNKANRIDRLTKNANNVFFCSSRRSLAHIEKHFKVKMNKQKAAAAKKKIKAKRIRTL